MKGVWEEVVFAAVAQLALAPFAGALREMHRVSDEVERGNRARHGAAERPLEPDRR